MLFSAGAALFNTGAAQAAISLQPANLVELPPVTTADAKLDEIRARLAIPSYPHPLLASTPVPPAAKPVAEDSAGSSAAAPGPAKPTQPSRAELAAAHAQETLATLDAFQAAIDSVGARKAFSTNAFVDK